MVLFAYDGSDAAKSAIREAGRQLSSGRRGLVLSVWEPLAAHPLAGDAAAWGLLDDDFEAAAAQVADEGARLARAAGFDATPLADTGNPVWERIVDAAAAHAAELVVLGSHGRTGIGLVLMGSVAESVSRHTELPVLIVHAPPTAAFMSSKTAPSTPSGLSSRLSTNGGMAPSRTALRTREEP
jgi:nucleotide-binding universal stress UspA family protein